MEKRSLDGAAVMIFQSNYTEGDKDNFYQMIVSADDNTPIQLYFLGFDRLFGSHYDEYVVMYDEFSSKTPDDSSFSVPDGKNLSVCVSVCVCLCMSVCVCLYVCLCVFVCVYVYVYVYVCMSVYVYIYVPVFVCLCVCLFPSVCVCVCVSMCACVSVCISQFNQTLSLHGVVEKCLVAKGNITVWGHTGCYGIPSPLDLVIMSYCIIV